MTTPGGGFSVTPADLHSHAAQRRMESTDFTTDKPPPVPPDPDDPTRSTTTDLTGAVQDTNQHMHDKTNRKADSVDGAGLNFITQEGQNASQLEHVGGANGKVAQGVDAAGFGSVMNAFLAPLGQLGSGLSQGLTGLMSGFAQGFSAIAGQGINASVNGATAMAKNTGLGAAVTPAAGAGGLVGTGGGAGQDQGATKPTASLQPHPGQPQSGHDGYVHTEAQDRDNTTVRTAGMGTPMGGLGAAPHSPTTSSTKPKTHPIAYGQQTDPPTEPIPVVEIREAAYALSPLQLKEANHGVDA